MDNQQWLEQELSCKTLPLVMERGRIGFAGIWGRWKQNCRQSEPLKERENWKTENWILTANAFTITCVPLEGGPSLPLAPGVGLSPSVRMELFKDNASDFSLRTPLGRGWEEREAAHPRISTNCVLRGSFSVTVSLFPQTLRRPLSRELRAWGASL